MSYAIQRGRWRRGCAFFGCFFDKQFAVGGDDEGNGHVENNLIDGRVSLN